MALTRLNNNAIGETLSVAKGGTGVTSADEIGNMVLLSTATASADSSIEFTSGIDSTYSIYRFEFINIHPATNDVNFSVNFRDGDTNFDATKTGTGAQLNINEDGTGAQFVHATALNAAQTTNAHQISHSTGNSNDESLSGHFILYNPSSTTFAKNYLGFIQNYHENNNSQLHFSEGYVNTTSAVDGVKFNFSSGNIDSGTIIMYGVKT